MKKLYEGNVSCRLVITQKVSNRVTPEVLKTLYSSMAPRIQAMVDTRSGPTNYIKDFSIILDIFHQKIAIMSKCRFKYCQDSIPIFSQMKTVQLLCSMYSFHPPAFVVIVCNASLNLVADPLIDYC